jgi:hypothetical protein
MTERAKINLRTLDFQLYTYGTEYPCPPLYLKSRYLNEELPNYAEQLAFDEALQSLNFNLSGYGPSQVDFTAALERARWQVSGYKLERLHRVPDLDEPCGQYLTYRQLIECGETQATTKISNLPKNPASYTALLELAIGIIDPVIEYFGGIKLTYGLCTAELARHIPGRVAPELDQHAASELKRGGRPICERGGAAVDFVVQDENMEEVAHWVIANLSFDRLYFYGRDKPLHISFGPNISREAFEMVQTAKGRRIPRRLIVDASSL